MVQSSVRNGLVQLSCILSMLGSTLVITTWAYPRKNRRKHGRILLLWLSVADFLSSSVYFIQTFHTSGNSICEISALLGIYFPVASFLWTDCIAYFLYLVVSNRSDYQPYNWNKLLRGFHIFVWTLSLITISLVFAFGHAGHASDDDDNDNTAGNTGGWCWITANSPRERFIWEVIGGKLIEWISCLVVLPYLYTSVYYQLAKVEGGDMRTTLGTGDGQASDQRQPLQPLHTSTNPTHNAFHNPAPSKQSRTSPATSTGEQMKKVKSIESLYDMSDLSGNAFIDVVSARNSFTTASEANPTFTPVSPAHHTGISLPTKVEPRMASVGSHPSGEQKGFFSKFYLKLAAVPLILIAIRIWSSVRIILQYARPHEDNADSFLEVMQAFFDPSQGIFNALIFVFASTEDREHLHNTLMRAQNYVYACITGRATSRQRGGDDKVEDDGSGGMRERLILPGGTRSKADSSSTGGHPSLLDVSSDYECDSSERMSEFSFDLTESNAQ